jgi:hypothetical protein
VWACQKPAAEMIAQLGALASLQEARQRANAGRAAPGGVVEVERVLAGF